MSLRALDLNLLPVLQALLSEASVTRASRRLGLSQPATSNALARLRHGLGDPLLVKVGNSMHLTARARHLLPAVNRACEAAESVWSEEGFNPKTAKRTFVIATPDYMALLLGRDLIPMCKAEAPGLIVRFVDVGPDFRQHILAGAVDIAIVAHIPGALDDLVVAGGFPEELVCVTGPGHPLAGRRSLRTADLSGQPRLGINAAPLPLLTGDHDPRFADGGQPVTVSASHMLALPLLAVQSDMLCVVPRALAGLVAELVPIRILDIADAEPLDLCLAWSRVTDPDAAHRWCRDFLADLLTRLFPAGRLGNGPAG